MRGSGIDAGGPPDARLLWRTGIGGRCDHFSQGWLEFTGRTVGEERDDDWLEGMHTDDIVMFLIEVRLLHREGTWRRVKVHGSPSLDAAGTFQGFAASCALNDGRGVLGQSSPFEAEP